MDFSALMTFFQTNFFANFIATQMSTSIFNYTFASLKKKFIKYDVSWQLLDCIENAHRDTCENLDWEYNPDAFLNSFLLSLKEAETQNLFSEMSLASAFINAMGHPVGSIEIKCWENCFLSQLSSEKYTQLREFIKLKLFVDSKSIPELQKRYIERLKQPQVSNDDRFLTLEDLYIPNKYKIGNSGQVYDDLFELINNFREGTVDNWLAQKGIRPTSKVYALFIYGYQCTGKTTLISKIISDYYLDQYSPETHLHMVSFGDRVLRNKELSIQSICEYLSIGTNQLLNSLLLIDGLDETNYSSSATLIQVEDLLNDLQELNCRPIITSRPNILFTNELLFALDIYLQPFSSSQAIEWINIYKTLFVTCDTTKVEKQISALSQKIQEVILIPYIFRTCIVHNIAMDQITELAKLYDLLFDGHNAEFFRTYYNSRQKFRAKEWEALQALITKMSIEYFKTNDNTISLLDFSDDIEEQQLSKISAEFFLLQKDSNRYTFIHDSIPNYFVAKRLYEAVALTDDEKKFKELASTLNAITGNNLAIPVSITDYIEYFVRKNHFLPTDMPIKYLKSFLNKELDSEFIIMADLDGIQRHYYQKFVSILRLVFAFIAPHTTVFSLFDLFSALSAEEKECFIKYSKLGDAALDCLRITNFSNQVLNGINLSGTNFKGKSITFTKMQNALLKNCNLSGAYLLDSDFTQSVFDNSHCHNADFSNSILVGCSFKNTRLSGADFSNANLINADFRGAKVNKCKFGGANLLYAKISAEQLLQLQDFDIPFIKENNIEVYSAGRLVSGELLDEIFKHQRPVAYSFYKHATSRQ